MILKQRIEAFVHLGEIMKTLGANEWEEKAGLTKEEFATFQDHIERAHHYNAWFVAENVRSQLLSLAFMLEPEPLSTWANNYREEPSQVHRVAIIMAGNIPLVGFHDLMCVLMSGHEALVKYSSEDDKLLPALIQLWGMSHPEMLSMVHTPKGKMENFSAVIATGSNNSARYFDQYFGGYPNIIRKNRTSVAVLNGEETPQQILELGKDVFGYFGLGCRNVTSLFLPRGFELDRLFEPWIAFQDIINHNKYANNYDYHKALWLMNQDSILDNGFLMLREENGRLVSPVGSLFFQTYDDMKNVKTIITERADEIQCVVGEGFIPFGQAQFPAIDDYADGVDTMAFLCSLA